MRVYYVSDLHIKSSTQRTAQLFCDFLKTIPCDGDTLILGGDIFDLFVGNKAVFHEEYKEILAAIKNLSKKNCKVYYLEGNHDFHMKNVFSGCQNVLMVKDDFALKWGGKSFWISHGDLINHKDYGYRLLHFLTRNSIFLMLVNLLPGKWLLEIGRWSSKTSRHYKAIESDESKEGRDLRLLYRNFACEKISAGYDFVFVGHSHQRDQFRCRVNERAGEYVNLGFSDEVLLYAQYMPGENSVHMKTHPVS